MQVSTRSEDWLVDTLALRARMHLLLPAFTDPDRVKVFHGADSDIVWLQVPAKRCRVTSITIGQ
jgi:exosome complex exonuclease RRP6